MYHSHVPSKDGVKQNKTVVEGVYTLNWEVLLSFKICSTCKSMLLALNSANNSTTMGTEKVHFLMLF